MADILNSNIGQANVPSVNVQQPYLNQAQAVSPEIDPSSMYGLKVQQMQDAAKAERQSALLAEQKQLRSEQRQHAWELTKDAISQQRKDQESLQLQKISESLISKYQEIDTKITNPIEKAKYKRDADLAAITAAGESGRAQVSDVIGRLKTTRETRPDGLINVLGADGQIIGIEGYDKDTILANQRIDNQKAIHEVFPNLLDTFDNTIAQDPTLSVAMQKNSSDIIMRLKNEAQRFKNISEDYHMGANTLPASQSQRLLDNAKTGYYKGISNVFDIFTSPDVLQSIRSGRGLNRANMDIALEQVKRDVIDEIVTQQVPIEMTDIEEYANKVVGNINSLYDNISKRDNVSLEQANTELKLQNEIQLNYARQKLNLSEIEAAQPLIDIITKITAAQTNLASTALASTNVNIKSVLEKQAAGMTSLSEGLMPKFEATQRQIYQSMFDLNSFKKNIVSAQSSGDITAAFRELSKVTNHDAGWAMAPYVKQAVDFILPTLKKQVAEGKMSEEDMNSYLDQLGQYEDYAKGMIESTGLSPEEYHSNLNKGMSIWSNLKGITSAFNASSYQQN